jgi:hypothetical protein
MTDKRMRGRAGQAALKRRRAMFPMCAHCAAIGVDKAADQIDHIKPLALGGLDVDDNCQGLCTMHHAVKSALEDASRGGASNHPEWLQAAGGKLTIVAGPPCSGKTSYVRDHANARDLVVDLDEIAEVIQPGWRRVWNGPLLDAAIRTRNAILGSLARAPVASRSWFIVSAPTAEELEWWTEKLKPSRVVRLDVPEATCLARAARRDPGRGASIVADWFARSRRPWRQERAKPKRQAFGKDGYPLEDAK